MTRSVPPTEVAAVAHGETDLRVERSTKLSERVARAILDDIVARGLTSGSMLPPESAMLERYRIGRASLREALRILETLGIISMKPGPRGGPVVGEVTGAQFGRASTFFYQSVGATLRELIEARLAIEPMMAGLAARRLTPQTAERVREVAQAGWDAREEPPAVWARATAVFHTGIGDAAGNKVLGLVSSSLVDIHGARLNPVFPVGGRDEVLSVHDKIAAAVLSGDAAKAERLMRRHTEHLFGNLQQLIPGLLDETIDWR